MVAPPCTGCWYELTVPSLWRFRPLVQLHALRCQRHLLLRPAAAAAPAAALAGQHRHSQEVPAGRRAQGCPSLAQRPQPVRRLLQVGYGGRHELQLKHPGAAAGRAGRAGWGLSCRPEQLAAKAARGPGGAWGPSAAETPPCQPSTSAALQSLQTVMSICQHPTPLPSPRPPVPRALVGAAR